MKKELVVTVDWDETRAALLEDGALAEYYVERPSGQRVAGNIYKGRVENVLPGMQAAFVNIGLEKNSFLYIDDAAPRGDLDEEELEHVKDLTIKDVLKVGQEIMVQVAKEPIGTKGARVTRYITLPGRYLVLMPQVEYVGVSRRIKDDKERERLKHIAQSIKPKGLGLIVRTVAEGADEQELAGDAQFLVRLWERIRARFAANPAPHLLHKDLGLLYRLVRDVFTPEIDSLTLDSRSEHEKVLELLEDSPELRGRVHLFQDRSRTIFEAYGIENEIEKALKKRVWLKSGGYLIIDQTEALTAIDVNTGKFVGTTNLADTVFQTNLEAAVEIARQLRLRDIGGIIVLDFIDMDVAEHRHEVVKALETALQRDRTKAVVLGLTQLGLVEMTRKKVRQSLDDVLLRPCPYCHGRGKVASEETQSRKVRGEIRRILKHTQSEAALFEVNTGVASLLIGAGGVNLRELEKETGKTIFIRGVDTMHVEEMNLRALGTRAEVEAAALPVRVGQTLEVTIEEVHAKETANGICRIQGYVIDVEGGGNRVGDKVRIEIVRAFRTYAKARIV